LNLTVAHTKDQTIGEVFFLLFFPDKARTSNPPQKEAENGCGKIRGDQSFLEFGSGPKIWSLVEAFGEIQAPDWL